MPKGRGSGSGRTAGSPRPPVRRQVSAGGVAVRRVGGTVEVAIIRPRGTDRWQLPKGIVDPGESPEVTARREVREEAGVDGDVVAPIEEIQYWYVGTDRDGVRVRFHKSVHFFLIVFRGGDVGDHDHEVAEARWVTPPEASQLLAFKNEKAIAEKAARMIDEMGNDEGRVP
jgi:8-oxo-dGTP pyrophosphatase MutT (NUDIX family)